MLRTVTVCFVIAVNEGLYRRCSRHKTPSRLDIFESQRNTIVGLTRSTHPKDDVCLEGKTYRENLGRSETSAKTLFVRYHAHYITIEFHPNSGSYLTAVTPPVGYEFTAIIKMPLVKAEITHVPGAAAR